MAQCEKCSICCCQQYFKYKLFYHSGDGMFFFTHVSIINENALYLWQKKKKNPDHHPDIFKNTHRSVLGDQSKI